MNDSPPMTAAIAVTAEGLAGSAGSISQLTAAVRMGLGLGLGLRPGLVAAAARFSARDRRVSRWARSSCSDGGRQ